MEKIKAQNFRQKLFLLIILIFLKYAVKVTSNKYELEKIL